MPSIASIATTASYRSELDMETLVVDAGPGFSAIAAGEPAALPALRSRYVVVLFEPPRGGARPQ